MRSTFDHNNEARSACPSAYDSVEEAIRLANDNAYGLASSIQCKEMDIARAAAARMRSGHLHIDHPAWDATMPFGACKQSGDGREYGEWGLADFLEVKTVAGHAC